MNTYAWIGIVLAVAAVVGVIVYMVTSRSPAAVVADAATSVAATATKIASGAGKAVTTAYDDLNRDFGAADLTFDPRLAGGVEV